MTQATLHKRRLAPREGQALADRYGLDPTADLLDGDFRLASAKLVRTRSGGWTARFVYRGRSPRGGIATITHTVRGLDLDPRTGSLTS